MTTTYKLIATASGTADGFTFTNIPQIYQDLRIVMIGRTSSEANAWIGMTVGFNGSGQSTNVVYRRYIKYNSGGGVSSIADTAGFFLNANGTNTTAGTYGIGIAYIKGYSDTDKYKPFGSYTGNTNNATAFLSGSESGQYRSNSAITQIDISAGATFGLTSASKISLYGITTS